MCNYDHPRLPGSSIADVTLRVFRAPATDGVAMSFGPMGHRSMAVVIIRLGDGSIGVGETWINYPHWAWRERCATIADGIAPLLVGKSFETPQAAHDYLTEKLDPLGRQWGAVGPIRQAISGVDAALWDLAAQHAQRSLTGLIAPGTSISELPLYASSLGPRDVDEGVRRCVADGHRSIKLKLGFGADDDLRNLEIARATAGPDVSLFADANQAWDLETAIAMAPALKDAGVEWLEEPLRGNDPAELRALKGATGLSLAMGENLYGTESFEAYVGIVDIFQPDISKIGGITDYLTVLALGERNGITVNPHLYNGSVAAFATIQLAAASPSTEILEWDVRENPLRKSVEVLTTGRGTVCVPDVVSVGDLVRLDEYKEYEVV